MEIATFLLSLLCAVMLVRVGLKIGNIFSYSLLMERVYGKRAKKVLDVIIALTQYGFTIPMMVFTCESLKTIVD
jgi:amino acid permease